MLGLVSYDDSDDSENENENETNKSTKLNSISNNNNNTENKTKKIFKISNLKNDENDNNNNSNTDEEEEALSRINLKNNKTGGSVPIPGPTFKQKTDSESAKLRSGLFSILPPPKKNPFLKSSTSLVPNQVKNKTASKFVETAKTTTSSIDSIPKISNNPYKNDELQAKSSINSAPTYQYTDDPDLEDEDGDDYEPEPKTSHIGNKKTLKNDSYEQLLTIFQYLKGPSTSTLSIDESTWSKLCGGGRRKQDIPDNIQITDVSAASIVGDNSSAIMMGLTDGYKPPNNRDYFSSGSKRKHQITYLAYVAKEREQELQATWAAGKLNKKLSRQKYGF
jgi:hypothetical protein